ncbi:MAG: phosphatase PAP2 family protein [Bacteroidota bacterium]|nr:phosphatase PAP2 family protein [Bacteroidota bacterium]MDP4232552.1 phosphatase PAP2 family protein [Bacteroidota bacterium]MDP4242993.1 phosphatase PAP2 family protein [Bacteroidota bacterium]MDP4286432.1 phosphatase PAP2 family protein [Bacteroidota bacterium]
MKRLLRSLLPHESFMVLMALVLSLVVVIGSSIIPEWPKVLLHMGEVVLIIGGMAFLSRDLDRSHSALQWFYAIPLIPVFFKNVEYLTQPLYDPNNDQILIAADRILCGGANPTQWIYQHGLTCPALTEFLMICYSLFYFLPTAIAIEFYVSARRMEKSGQDATMLWKRLEQIFFVVVYGFLLSYFCYLFLPSVGPRFTLHNFLSMSHDLPGLFVTEPIRTLLNRGENILPSMSLPEIIHVVTRDAFPSGHTDVTLLTIVLAFKWRAKLRWPVTIIGAGLLISTVYLRYHYVVDVLGGAVLATFTLYTWEWVRSSTLAIRNRIVSS